MRQRRGTTYALRNALVVAPSLRTIAESDSVRELAINALEADDAFATRAIVFDKNPDANWRVRWHQDTSIAVESRIELPGFGPWSEKAGVLHVRPPADVLAHMITVRLGLDDCSNEDGPLLVLPGSHNRGFLDSGQIETLRRAVEPVACTGNAGDAVLMRPLLLHASSQATRPTHRRVLHLEFTARALPGGLRWNHA